jgi:hypothetical protein
MGRAAKTAVLAAVCAVALGLVAFTTLAWVRTSPPTVDFTAGHAAGQPIDVHLQVVGAYGHSPHPDWVSYEIQRPDGQWVHTTLFTVPAHTLVHFTIDQYDSGGALRNQQIGQVTGTVGGAMLLNGKRTTVIDSNAGAGVGHTFSIPTIGLNVPLAADGAPDSQICGSAPCALTSPHNRVQFTIRTPGPGDYPWQCFVPCALGWLYGNGGPMQNIGWMDGLMEVAG